MSSHYLLIICDKCAKSESLHTGSIETEDFDDEDWEGNLIYVPKCIECKSKEAEGSMIDLCADCGHDNAEHAVDDAGVRYCRGGKGVLGLGRRAPCWRSCPQESENDL